MSWESICFRRYCASADLPQGPSPLSCPPVVSRCGTTDPEYPCGILRLQVFNSMPHVAETLFPLKALSSWLHRFTSRQTRMGVRDHPHCRSGWPCRCDISPSPPLRARTYAHSLMGPLLLPSAAVAPLTISCIDMLSWGIVHMAMPAAYPWAVPSIPSTVVQLYGGRSLANALRWSGVLSQLRSPIGADLALWASCHWRPCASSSPAIPRSHLPCGRPPAISCLSSACMDGHGSTGARWSCGAR